MITQEYLKSIISYDKTTGVFIYLKQVNNKCYIGQILNNKGKNGYYRVSIDYKRYYLHRLAWLYEYGHFPKNKIDHIDGNKLNNALSNLRDVTDRQNSQNLQKHREGKLVGATFCPDRAPRKKKWRASIIINKTQTYLGYYLTEQEAHNAYVKKYKEIKDQ